MIILTIEILRNELMMTYIIIFRGGICCDRMTSFIRVPACQSVNDLADYLSFFNRNIMSLILNFWNGKTGVGTFLGCISFAARAQVCRIPYLQSHRTDGVSYRIGPILILSYNTIPYTHHTPQTARSEHRSKTSPTLNNRYSATPLTSRVSRWFHQHTITTIPPHS